MDQNSIELCQNIIREKIVALQNSFESDNLDLKAKLEYTLSQLEAKDNKSVSDVNMEYDKDVEIIKIRFQSKISELENEIAYLNERHLSQNLMLEDTFLYAQKLEEEIKILNNNK